MEQSPEQGHGRFALCAATLERNGSPHRCLLGAGHEGQHACLSCGVTW